MQLEPPYQQKRQEDEQELSGPKQMELAQIERAGYQARREIKSLIPRAH